MQPLAKKFRQAARAIYKRNQHSCHVLCAYFNVSFLNIGIYGELFSPYDCDDPNWLWAALKDPKDRKDRKEWRVMSLLLAAEMIETGDFYL